MFRNPDPFVSNRRLSELSLTGWSCRGLNTGSADTGEVKSPRTSDGSGPPCCEFSGGTSERASEEVLRVKVLKVLSFYFFKANSLLRFNNNYYNNNNNNNYN